jgi:hypothetical protein
MGYEYDVFLSYLHEKPSGTWVVQHFLPYFQHQLGNALARRAALFIDRTGIHLGQKWPARLKQALGHSRCLVGIWSPLYFQSEWCLCECAVMRHRETKLGFGTAENTEGLIVGVRVNDGIHFPEYARESQSADMEKYFFDEHGFSQSPLYVDFQKQIAELAREVARVVNNAPPWADEWVSPAWIDEVVAGVQVGDAPKASQPSLA